MRNPVVGGYTPEKVALRRAIALAFDNRAAIAIAPSEVDAQRWATPQLIANFVLDRLAHAD